jgi:hypothetical protein
MAVLGSWICYEFLYWNVPRRNPWVPTILLALAASYLIYWAVTYLKRELGGLKKLGLVALTSFAGVIAACYLAVKVGTPAHATVVIICDNLGVPNQVDDDGRSSSSEEREAELRGFREDRGLEHPAPPAVWPEHFFVAQEGSVSWLLYGEPGTKVRIVFDKDDDPFSVAGDRESPSEFIGIIPELTERNRTISVPGIIVAGPTVRGWRSGYTIIVTYPDGTEKTIDPDGEGPRKHA